MVCRSKLVQRCVTMGPRQTMAWSLSIKSRWNWTEAMAHHGLNGLAVDRLRSTNDAQHGWNAGAVDISIQTPTVAPSAARAKARLTVVVDLPTPPLPEATAIMFFHIGDQLDTALNRMGDDLVADRDAGHCQHQAGS